MAECDVYHRKYQGLCRSCSQIKTWSDTRRLSVDSEGMRTCARCNEMKHKSEFSRDKYKRDGIRAYCRKCMAEKAAAYRVKNRERVLASRRASKAKRRAQKYKSEGSFSTDDWNTVLEYYGHRCLECGSVKDLQPDHVIPLSKGGPHNIENIQPLCGRCNRIKQATFVDYRNGNICRSAVTA